MSQDLALLLVCLAVILAAYFKPNVPRRIRRPKGETDDT